MDYSVALEKNDRDLYTLRWNNHLDTVSGKSKGQNSIYISIPQIEDGKC